MPASNYAIGRREYGQRAIGERWYHCAIMDEVVPESETTIETDPLSKFFGMRVCFAHKDEPGHDSFRLRDPFRGNPGEEAGP